jgi:hypothetical protein
VFDQWQPIWLKGFKPGRNWVQLELIDESGNPIDNRFNNTVRIIDYQPGGSDTLSRLVRGELDIKDVAGIIDPTYAPPAPPEPEAEPAATPQPENAAPEALAPPPAEASGAETQPEAPAPESGPQPAPSLAEPSAEKSSAEPPAPDDSPTPAENDDAIQPNPFLRPEVPPAAEALAPLAPKDPSEITSEDRGTIAPENEQPKTDRPKTADQPADPLNSSTADDSTKDDIDVLKLPETPAVPPVLVEPDIQLDDIQSEALPEPEPLSPQPLVSPDEKPTPAPTDKGLLGRFKQWRGQPEAAPAPEDFSGSPQAIPEEVPTPEPELPQQPNPEASPQQTGEIPEDSEPLTKSNAAKPNVTEPNATLLRPQQDAPDLEQAPDTDDDEQGSVELPRPNSRPRGERSPIAPEVRPFI